MPLLDLRDRPSSVVQMPSVAPQNLSISHQAEAMRQARKSGVFFSSGGIDRLMRAVATSFLEGVATPRIYDPTCGRGYLLNAFADVPSAVLIGNDIDPINTGFLEQGAAGFPCDVHTGDGLTYRPQDPVDLVVANPPFSLKWDRTTARIDLAQRWTMPPNKAADWAFVLNAFECLTASGALLCIAFPGALYRGQKEEAIRRELVSAGHVRAVVSLPANLFEDTQIAVALLVLTKAPTKVVRFVDASQCFQKERRTHHLTGKGIKAIAAALSGEETELPHATTTVSEIQERSWNLSPSSYITQPNTQEVIDIKAVNAELAALKISRVKLEEELDALIEEITKEEGLTSSPP